MLFSSRGIITPMLRLLEPVYYEDLKIRYEKFVEI
jgi:hypothetical protein